MRFRLTPNQNETLAWVLFVSSVLLALVAWLLCIRLLWATTVRGLIDMTGGLP